jgi:hypothetical protein
VQKEEQYPIGMPFLFGAEHLSKAFASGKLPSRPWTKNVAEKFPFKGLLFVRVLAPKQMPFNGRLPPFLPYRTTAGNLVFPLCAECAEKKQQTACKHRWEKRSWTAAFTHFDVSLALNLGYKILDVFEVKTIFFY